MRSNSKITKTQEILKIIFEISRDVLNDLPTKSSIIKAFKNYNLKMSNPMLYQLEKRGYLRKIELEGDVVYRLTRRGRLKILKYYYGGYSKKDTNWDGKWRIVIFDIPNTKKKAREAFRGKLYELGFKKFQKSVWVYPYEAKEYLDIVIEEFYLSPYVSYLVTNSVTNEERLLKKFKLKRNIRSGK